MAGFEIPRAVLELYRFTSKEDARVNLQYINIVKEKGSLGSVTATATDGHRFCHFSWPPHEKADYSGLPFDLLGAEARDILANSSRKRVVGTTTFSLALSKTPFVETSEGKRFLLSKKPDDAMDFPDWQQLKPQRLSERNPISSQYPQVYGVDLDYFMDFSKFLKSIGSRPQVTFHYLGDQVRFGPILIVPQYEGVGTIEYVVMPCRCSEADKECSCIKKKLRGDKLNEIYQKT